LNSRLKQGDIIGYVGMTGLATGPHVCYRFKKDGEQVNPSEHNAGTSSRISPGKLKNYMDEIAPLQTAIKRVEYF
jgi:murein DD-endopeptidase MepM/ murein hydrolase activator NlpD